MAERQRKEFDKSVAELKNLEQKLYEQNKPILTEEEQARRKSVFDKLKEKWNKLSSKDSGNRADLDEGFAADLSGALNSDGTEVAAHGMSKSSLASSLE